MAASPNGLGAGTEPASPGGRAPSCRGRGRPGRGRPACRLTAGPDCLTGRQSASGPAGYLPVGSQASWLGPLRRRFGRPPNRRKPAGPSQSGVARSRPNASTMSGQARRRRLVADGESTRATPMTATPATVIGPLESCGALGRRFRRRGGPRRARCGQPLRWPLTVGAVRAIMRFDSTGRPFRQAQ